jgi:GWxTD domain-containing protein
MRTIVARVVVLAVLSAGLLAQQGPAPMPNDEWKRWLDQVGPLMLQAERKEAKTTAPSQRAQFREDFWQARNPDPSNPDNPVRAEFESRIQTAEKRFRINGKSGWTDCGRTFLVLGKPDWMRNNHVTQHFSGSDPMRAFQAQENTATEEWIYRNPPRLPPSPEGYVFRFNPACESIAGRSADRLLDQVAASYVVHPR